MKEKFIIIVALLIFSIASFYLPLTNFKCGLQDGAPQSAVINGKTVNLSPTHISCSNEVLKIFLNLSKLLTGILFLVSFLIAIFLKNRIRKYFYIVMTLFVFTLFLKYALYGLIIYYEGNL